MQPSPLGLSSENKRRNEPGLLQNPFPPSAATAGSTSILHGQHNPYDPNSGSGNQAHDTFHARPSPAFSQPSMMAMHMNTPHHFVGHASPSTLAAGPGPSTVMLPPIGVGSKAQNHDTDKVPRSESGDISVSLAADDNPSGMKKRIQSCDICRIRKVKCVRLDESKVSRCKQCEVNDVNCTFATAQNIYARHVTNLDHPRIRHLRIRAQKAWSTDIVSRPFAFPTASIDIPL